LIGSVIVKCSQTGEQLCVKVQDLTKEGALPLLNEGLCEGSSLLLERDHKVFPVQFIKFKGLEFVALCRFVYNYMCNQTKSS